MQEREAEYNEVSILVLVDVGLRLSRTTAILETHDSFNPCFSGCWSSTITDLKAGDKVYMFQSLF